MKIVCVIPARGGSKGILNKNLMLVGGIPLVARSILASKNCDLIQETYVSSDSDKILDVSNMYGAKKTKRPSDISEDLSSTDEVLLHFIKERNLHEDKNSILVFLQCTSPFTTSQDIKKVVQTLINYPDIDCAFSANEDHSFLWSIDKNDSGIGINHEAYKSRKRRQDLEVSYKENGAVYAVRTNALIKTKNRFGSKALPVKISTSMPFEIDDEIELQIAQASSHLYRNPLQFSLSDCHVLFMDFDGVHTNDKMLLREDGVEHVTVSRADGMGISILKEKGINPIILTREENSVVSQRAKKLNIEINFGVKNKLEFLKDWAIKNNYKSENIAYVGNDINDLDCMNWVGMPFSPSDAHPDIMSSGCRVLSTKGGSGVIRELADIILRK